MTSRRTVPTAIIGLIVIAVTLLIFFTAVTERHAIQWVSLLFIIFAELITTGGFILIDEYAKNTSGVMLRAGTYSLLFIYFIATTAVSIMYMSGVGGSVKWLVMIEFIILALTVAIMVPIFASSKTINEKNRSVLQSAAMLKQLGDSVMLLKNAKNSKYTAQLEKIYDAIRYCDNSVYVPSDDLIAVKINELEEVLGADAGEDERVNAMTDEILLLAKKRASEARGIQSEGL